MRRAVVLCLALGCGKSAEPTPDTAAEAAVVDGGGAGAPSTTVTAHPPGPPPMPFPRVHLTLSLRSSPPGAAAAVDGHPVGQTPVVYALDSDGRPHEFTFVLPGYAPWRVRFPPVKDGVIHATLRPMTFGDAGP